MLFGSLLGLAGAHARGVVHRDYKPANVLVNSRGASKLTDFGIAARAGTRGIPAASRNYAPPEQYDGSPASPAGDVYAATATFYECLTGHPPFTGQTDETLLEQHRSAPVPMEAVPEPLRPLVARGMAKDARDRPADAAALAAELRTVATGAHGEDWEARGRSHLGEAALLLALLWPSAGTPALTGTTVEQVQLSQVLREAGRRLLSPETRTRPLSRETTRHLTRHLLTRAERHRLHLWHVLHLDHLAHEKYLRRLRNAALVTTGAAVVAAGLTVAATSGSHASASSAAPGATGTIGHPAVAAYPVSVANGAAAAPAASAASTNYCTNTLNGTAALPLSATSVARAFQQAMAACSGHVVSVTCHMTENLVDYEQYSCSIPAQEAAEVGSVYTTNQLDTTPDTGAWQYVGSD